MRILVSVLRFRPPGTSLTKRQPMQVGVLFPEPDILSILLFPEFAIDHHVVGVVGRLLPREFEDRRYHPVEHRSPQPGVGEKKSRSESRKEYGYIVASRQEVQQAECEDADDEWPAHGFGQEADNAQLPLSSPRKSCKESAQQQSSHDPARAEVIGQDPDDKKTGIGHRAG